MKGRDRTGEADTELVKKSHRKLRGE
jgi:hypothetical protein